MPQFFWLLPKQTPKKEAAAMKQGVKKRGAAGKTAQLLVDKMKNIITAAVPLVSSELIAGVAAALVAIRQVGTNVLAAMIHHSAHILSCRPTRCKQT